MGLILEEHMKQKNLIKKYDKQVTMYEKNRENPNMAAWRRKIINSAYGNILEVGIGVGANFSHYNKEKVHVTGVDFSAEMIKSAKKAASRYQIDTELIHADLDDLDFSPESFDCIVSTLTLCSYPDPVNTLNKFNSWCKNDGKILLLEHGLSHNPFWSLTLKAIDPIYSRIAGCHCNRNIQKIVENSKLEVEQMERHWGGILYLIWAKPGLKPKETV